MIDLTVELQELARLAREEARIRSDMHQHASELAFAARVLCSQTPASESADLKKSDVARWANEYEKSVQELASLRTRRDIDRKQLQEMRAALGDAEAVILRWNTLTGSGELERRIEALLKETDPENNR